MIINLTNIEEPKPTPTMLMVICNLRRYNYIGEKEFNLAVTNFSIASEYIGQFQEAMHNEVRSKVAVYMTRRQNRKTRQYSHMSECDEELYNCLNPADFY